MGQSKSCTSWKLSVVAEPLNKIQKIKSISEAAEIWLNLLLHDVLTFSSQSFLEKIPILTRQFNFQTHYLILQDPKFQGQQLSSVQENSIEM